MRMRMSITINYFHWYEIPFPRLPSSDVRARELIDASARLSMVPLDTAADRMRGWVPRDKTPLNVNYETWSRQYIRAEIDARVAALYGLSVYDYAYILTTFPLLDRKQPALPGDRSVKGKSHSYITRDLALLTYFRLLEIRPPEDIATFYREININIDSQTGEVRKLEERVERAQSIGAIAYVPTGSVPLKS